MQSDNIIIFVIAGSLLIIILVSMLFLLIRSLMQGIRLQNKLQHDVSRLRIHKMLRHRHIDVKRYLRAERSADILEQTDNCESCPTLEACDQALQQPSDSEQDLSFCPNDAALKKIQDKQS